MNIKKIPGTFSICKVSDYSQVTRDAVFCFTGQTDEEKSLVCLTEHVPENTTEREDGWKAFRIQGMLDFSLIGILAKITSLLAENHIGIFAISTYHTDYILTGTLRESASGTGGRRVFCGSITSVPDCDIQWAERSFHTRSGAKISKTSFREGTNSLLWKRK